MRGLSLGHWLELLQLTSLVSVVFPRSRDPSGDLAVAKTWSKSGHFHHILYFSQREGHWD